MFYKNQKIPNNNNKIFTNQTVVYTFKKDIDKVFGACFNLKILEKAGILGQIYTLTDQPKPSNKKETLLEFCRPVFCSLKLENIKLINEPHRKTLIQKINSMNGNEITTNFFLKYNYFLNTNNNSTIVIFEVQTEKENDPLIEDYLNYVPKETKIMFCERIESFLDQLDKPVLSIESIVIDRPLDIIWNYISDFKAFYESINTNRSVEVDESNKKNVYLVKNNNNLLVKYITKKQIIGNNRAILHFKKELNGSKAIKGNISVIKLSPISCFIAIENKIPFYVNGEFLICLSEYHQSVLKKMKDNLEKKVCYNDNCCLNKCI